MTRKEHLEQLIRKIAGYIRSRKETITEQRLLLERDVVEYNLLFETYNREFAKDHIAFKSVEDL